MSFSVLFRVPFTVFCLFWCPLQLSCSFSRLALRLLPLVFFCSLSLFHFFLFSLKTLSPQLESQQFPPVDKAFNYLCRYCCFASLLEIAKYWELLFNFNLTSLISRSERGLQIICLRGFTSTSPREALVQCLAVCPRYTTLVLETRVCALHCHLPVFPGAH